MNTLWFKRKTYGYGWYPITWQGWLVVILFIAFTVWNFHRIDATSQSNSDTLRPFVIQTILSVGVLVAICTKTGEAPRWQWGEKRPKKK